MDQPEQVAGKKDTFYGVGAFSPFLHFLPYTVYFCRC